MKLLVFGGSFNPVHWGHLLAAEELREEFGYDLVLFVPAARPPHKTLLDDPGAEERIEMLRLAVSGNSTFRIDDCEIGREGLSYTVDTLKELPERYHIDGKPGLVIGDDLASGFKDWHCPAEIAGLSDIIVARRSGAAFELPYPHREAHNRLIPISSSEIRARLASGRSVRYLLPDPVFEYIGKKGLYHAC